MISRIKIFSKALKHITSGLLFLVGAVFFCIACNLTEKKDKNETNPPLAGTKPLFEFTDRIVNVSGIAKTTGEFSIYISYPVFSSDSVDVTKLIEHVMKQIGDRDAGDFDYLLTKENKYDVQAFADGILDSWVTFEEPAFIGSIYDSLFIKVVLNTDLITLYKRHKGFWGGAHGDESIEYTMFDRDFHIIKSYDIILPNRRDRFKKLLEKEFNRQLKDDLRKGYPDKSNPVFFVLVPDGMIVQYMGECYADGNPLMLIKPEKFMDFIKPQYRKIYTQNARK
ncbi:MAG: hypothetical protein Q8M98_02710 [Candidatus Cloacimonadaceae bacterium]|nr:hypothetical protein [Candidatus Cloacimonadaceae bacterium]